jgi:predicted RNase H-like nuclease (RuvC/YqgF family)
MNSEWKDRLTRTVRETEETIRHNESVEHARKISELTKALEDKAKEIEELKARRDQLEREV